MIIFPPKCCSEKTNMKHKNDISSSLSSLNDCGITDVAYLTQTLAETKALTFLKELDLSNNNIGYSKKQLNDVLQHSNCNLR